MEFSNPNEVWIGSCKGLSLIHTELDGFEKRFTAEATLEDSIKGYLDGMNSCRSIVEWSADSLVFTTNSHGIRLDHPEGNTMLIEENGSGAALFATKDTLFTATPLWNRDHDPRTSTPHTIPNTDRRPHLGHAQN